MVFHPTRTARAALMIVFGLGTFSQVACGGQPAAVVSPPAETTAAADTTGDEVEPSTATACSEWDPEADPLLAPADVAAPPDDARRSATGMRFCILRPGEGDVRPSREARVQVHYTGWTTDGEMFDSSHVRGAPATFGVSEVIRGWTETLTHMTVGQVRRVWIPEELAYQGRAGSPPGMLVFDIELIAIQ